MSRASELLAQYERKIGKVGQWIAVRGYGGVGGERTWTDTPAKAYMTYKPAKEFVGSVIQNYAVVVTLAETLSELMPPLSTNYRLVTAFTGFDDLSVAPPVNEDGHVTGSLKESAIFSIMKRNPGGKLIAYEIYAVG